MDKASKTLVAEKIKAAKTQAKLVTRLSQKMLETAFDCETFSYTDPSQKGEWRRLQDLANDANRAFHSALAEYNGMLWGIRRAQEDALKA